MTKVDTAVWLVCAVIIVMASVAGFNTGLYDEIAFAMLMLSVVVTVVVSFVVSIRHGHLPVFFIWEIDKITSCSFNRNEKRILYVAVSLFFSSVVVFLLGLFHF